MAACNTSREYIMAGENSGMDISVGEKMAPEPTDGSEVSSKLKDVNGETSQTVVDDNDEAADQASDQKEGMRIPLND